MSWKITALVLATLLASGCTTFRMSQFHTETHYAPPNSNVIPGSEVTYTRSRMCGKFGLPRQKDAVIAINKAIAKSGADLLINTKVDFKKKSFFRPEGFNVAGLGISLLAAPAGAPELAIVGLVISLAGNFLELARCEVTVTGTAATMTVGKQGLDAPAQ